MVENVVATLGACWLLLAPVLCAAGVVTHPCECSEGLKECGACCAGNHGCDCVDRGCSHDGCDNDPCGVAVRTDKDSRAELREPLLEGLVAGLIHFLQAERPPACRSLNTTSSGPAGLTRNLPYPPSDVPLLV